MASGDAWNAGWGLGTQLAQQRNAQKQGRANELWEDKRGEFKTNIANLTEKYRSLLGPNGEDTPESLKVKYALNQANLTKDQFENPPKGPGAINRLGKLVHLSKTPHEQSVTTQTGGVGLGSEAPAPPLSNTQAPVATPATAPATAPATPASLSAAAKQLGQPQTPEPGIPQGTAAGLGGGAAPTTPGQKYTVKTPAGTPQQLRQRAQANRVAQQETELGLAGAALSPGQQAVQASHAATAGALASVQDTMKMFDTLNPQASPGERQSFQGEVTRAALKMTEKPLLKLYTLPDGNKAWLDASRPDLIPPGATADITETADTRKRADYQKFLQTHTDYEAKGGTFEKWLTEQAAAGRAAVPKPQTPDQQFMAIEQKRAKGEPLTADDTAFQAAYRNWIYTKVTQPKEAGYQALAWSRIVQAEVPGRPGEMQYVPAGVAYKGQMRGPSSLSHLMTVYYGTGKGGQDLLRFNTATHHLNLMAQLADALNNGNIQLFNRLGNEWVTATGGAAPTNFNDIRDAVAGELSRLYTGVGATEQEIANIESGVNNAQSPEQLEGTIQTDLQTMQGKIQAAAQQYVMGTEGNPAFPEDMVPPPAAAPQAPAPSPGALRDQAQQNAGGGKRHKIRIGKKFYIYKGTGDHADLKNYTEVPQ